MTKAPPPARGGGYWRGLRAVSNILHANLMRDVRSKFGDTKLGYLWGLSGVFSTMAVFYFLRGSVGASYPMPVDLLTAVCTGFFPYFLFRNVAGSIMGATLANRALLYYPGVRPLDFVFSGAVLEGVTITVAFAIGLTLNYQFVDVPNVDNPLKVISALLGAWLLGAGLGMCQMCVVSLNPAMKNLFGLLMRPMLFLSGVIYMATEMPYFVLDLLWWNPVFHFTELVREGLVRGYDSPLADDYYPYFWVIVFWGSGLAGERYLRRNFRASVR